MAEDDHAILTGISWYPNPGFTQLQGPPNDVELVKNWLITKAAVPEVNIQIVATPKPVPEGVKSYRAPPIGRDFDDKFQDLIEARMALGADRVKGRLYLYFSGHGFCSRSQERPSEAALYCANATREMYEHIYGTQYARIAQSWALFKEIVLVMDCCRDAELTKSPTPRPYRDTPSDDLAADVQVLAIYATPKGGKAHERPIPDRGNTVHGLLTHALVKLLDEAPSTGGLSATSLRDKIFQGWEAICGEDGAPRPEIYLPANGEMYFQGGGEGSPFDFRCTTPPQPGAVLTLINSAFVDVATFSLAGDGADQVVPNGPVLNYSRDAQELKLRMAQGFYQYKLSHPAKEGMFIVDGGERYVEL